MDDKRKTNITFTEKGKAMLDTVPPLWGSEI